MALTKTNFYNYSGYNSTTVNDLAVDYLLSTFQELLEEQLGYVFSLLNVVEEDKHNFFVENTDFQEFISIGAWQDSGLTIKKGEYDKSNLSALTTSPLILGQDYELFRFKTGFKKLPKSLAKANPAVAIKLYCPLYHNEFLRIYGTWGFSNGLPADLEYLIYTALKNAIEYNDSTGKNFENGGSGGGSGSVSSIREYTTSVTFSSSEKSQDFARNYFLDFLNTPNARAIIARYELQFNQTNFFI